jgi:hypothetical protein
MKTIIKLIDLLNRCLESDHKKRGLACIICMTILAIVFAFGLFYTINNFINKPINTNLHLEKAK